MRKTLTLEWQARGRNESLSGVGRKRDERIEQKWGRLAPVAKFLSDEPPIDAIASGDTKAVLAAARSFIDGA